MRSPVRPAMMIRTALLSLAMATPAVAETPLPFDLGGAYTLTNQHGERYTQADPDGKPQLLFFGYVNCQEICSAVFPMMAEVVNEIDAQGMDITPVMITVDPVRDTVDTMGPKLAEHHPDFVGLTGTEAELQVAYDAYSIEKEEVFVDPEFGPVYAHGSFVYLLDAEGKFLTLVPPIVTPQQAADIVAKYTKDLS
ncbi:SCO family protein [uncultured Litoreibacter sp.]|uniref:SCO family protein n=2 Tax=uncultured Litoreibacter sp. TaxID=1392394 RepID=UPI0026176D00|nr:SCO family protein [uncultured Litoreibacter sp.]